MTDIDRKLQQTGVIQAGESQNLDSAACQRASRENFSTVAASIQKQEFRKNTVVSLKTLSELGYSRAGYDFYRWQVVSNELCVGVQLSDGQEVYLSDENVHLSGLWTPIQYGIHYYLDGGT